MSKSSGGVRRDTLKQESRRYRENLKKAETGIRTKRYEVGVVLDEKGNVLVRRKGKAREVGFTKEDQKKMKDNILTLNHPTSLGKRGIKAIGNPFSPQDTVLAVANNVKEIRAVTPTYTFSLKRPKGGWKANWKEVAKAYDSAHWKYRKKLQNYIDTYKSSNKKTAIERAEVLHWNLVNKEVAKKFGWVYTHKKG